MSRIKRDDGVGFESDSFLDIIANIVGILIILIVLAGVRVSQSPVTSPQNIPIEPVTEISQSLVLEATLPEETKPQIIEKSPQLLAQEAKMKQELALLKREQQAGQIQSNSLALLQQEKQNKLLQLKQQLLQEEKTAEAAAKKTNDLRSLLQREQKNLAAVQASWDEANQQQTNVKQIKHKLTPIGHEVKGEELHFHLQGNKIAYVPIKKLFDHLKPQIQKRQQWLTKYHQHQGEVGPVSGFTMKYILERQRLTVIEELRSGRGLMRISVTGWKVIPEQDLEAETATQALQRNSEFIAVLQRAPLDATLTMWVYPDSFPLYRQLQQFAQREGYTIAARPLPAGHHISGSPSGSKSVGQ